MPAATAVRRACSATAAAFLADNGFTAVRLGVIWAAVEPEPGVIDTAYLDSINQTVKTLADRGIYTIIDMHQDLWSTELHGEGAPAWATMTGGKANPALPFPIGYWLSPAQNCAWKSFWDNVAAPDGLDLQDHYAQMWESVASYFSGNPAVIGYEVTNEPFPGPTWLATMFGVPFFGTQQLAPMYNQVDAAIRAVDPERSEHRSCMAQLLCRSTRSALHLHLRAHRPGIRPVCHAPRHAVIPERVRRDQQGL
jgi:endoglycosylceramidase